MCGWEIEYSVVFLMFPILRRLVVLVALGMEKRWLEKRWLEKRELEKREWEREGVGKESGKNTEKKENRRQIEVNLLSGPKIIQVHI
jgi:hypothetical protein